MSRYFCTWLINNGIESYYSNDIIEEYPVNYMLNKKTTNKILMWFVKIDEDLFYEKEVEKDE